MIPQDEFATIVAGVVTASSFQLIGPTGDVVAELGTVNLFGVDQPGLVLKHLSSVVNDSALAWTQTGAFDEQTTLYGPAIPTGPLPPYVTLTADAPSTTQGAEMSAGKPSGLSHAGKLTLGAGTTGTAILSIDGTASTLLQMTDSQIDLFVQGSGPVNVNNRRVWGTSTWATGTGFVNYGGSTTNVTSTRRWRIVDGDVVEVEFGWALGGVPSAGAIALILPQPVQAFTGAGNTFVVIGTASAIDQGAARYMAAGVIVDFDASATTARIQNATGAFGYWSEAAPFGWGTSADFGQAFVRYRYQ